MCTCGGGGVFLPSAFIYLIVPELDNTMRCNTIQYYFARAGAFNEQQRALTAPTNHLLNRTSWIFLNCRNETGIE